MTSDTGERQGASAEAVEHHYDIGTDFYRLWLDSDLTYSCARWADGDDLERAQQRKLEYLIEQAGLTGTERILDIGCGWGSLMRAVTARYPQTRATGLTLSRDQYRHLSAAPVERTDVRLEHWRDHRVETPYDAIFCIGALEHFVRFGRSRSERTATYRNFFAYCHSMIRPGGGLVVQTIGKGNRPLDQNSIPDVQFLADEIFPESDPPRLAELAHASEKLFEIRSVVNDRLDYATTCAEWLHRLRAQRAEAEQVAGARVTEAYERYLEASIRQFEGQHLVLYRIGLRAVGGPPSAAG